jgi:hypothetical protein
MLGEHDNKIRLDHSIIVQLDTDGCIKDLSKALLPKMIQNSKLKLPGYSLVNDARRWYHKQLSSDQLVGMAIIR